MDIVGGTRIGPFVVFVDEDGMRHAVRISSVLCVADADDRRDSTVIQLPGGRVVLVQIPLEQILGWFG